MNENDDVCFLLCLDGEAFSPIVDWLHIIVTAEDSEDGKGGKRRSTCTEIGKKARLFAKLQPGRARKRINAT